MDTERRAMLDLIDEQGGPLTEAQIARFARIRALRLEHARLVREADYERDAAEHKERMAERLAEELTALGVDVELP